MRHDGRQSQKAFYRDVAGVGRCVWQSGFCKGRHGCLAIGPQRLEAPVLYDNNGQLVRQLTSGKWEVRTLYGVDEKNGWVYFSATKDSHIAENVYRVRVTGGEPSASQRAMAGTRRGVQ